MKIVGKDLTLIEEALEYTISLCDDDDVHDLQTLLLEIKSRDEDDQYAEVCDDYKVGDVFSDFRGGMISFNPDHHRADEFELQMNRMINKYGADRVESQMGRVMTQRLDTIGSFIEGLAELPAIFAEQDKED